jgi:hypothetical protein
VTKPPPADTGRGLPSTARESGKGFSGFNDNPSIILYLREERLIRMNLDVHDTPAQQAPDRVTDEATEEGLRLAKEAGDAYLRMVDYFIAHVATSGAKKEAGPYVIAFATEHAEPLYRLLGDTLILSEPADGENAHLEVVVADAADGRFIPELTVHVSLSDSNGKEVGTYHLPFLWHPTMYHYGRSIHAPSDGMYTARVAIGVPTFARHDKINGKRYAQPVTTTFRDVKISTGRK